MESPWYSRSVGFLGQQQQPAGDFISLSSVTEKPHRPDLAYRCIFQNALILDCLSALPSDPSVQAIQDKLVDFLLLQRSDHWSFNYWVRNTPEAKSMPYPDDLDDTACTLAAVAKVRPTCLDGTALAQITKLLTTLEEHVGGPYRTWVVPKIAPAAWQDVDLAVNANIGYFLSLQGITLPRLVTLIEQAIVSNSFISSYYTSLYPVAYFIARWYTGPLHEHLVTTIFKNQKNGHWEGPLETALATTTLLRLGVPASRLQSALQYLTTSMTGDGAWPGASLYPDPPHNGVIYYAGSAALTTAFCLEALALGYQQKTKQKSASGSESLNATFYKKLDTAVSKRFRRAGSDTYQAAEPLVKKVLLYDQEKSLSLTPLAFTNALGIHQRDIPTNVLIKAGLVSIYGWIAYTIYDDFLDNEGTPALLPVANIALRELIITTAELAPAQPTFMQHVQVTLDTMEQANVWEVRHCRSTNPLVLPVFPVGSLADRSEGHSLATLGVLYSLGYARKKNILSAVQLFFRHYLTARQLHDDMHDWETDLAGGTVNAVATQLLRDCKATTTIPPLSELRRFFWHHTALRIFQQILTELDAAEKAIQRCGAFTTPEHIFDVTHPLRTLTEQAVREHARTTEFICAYGKVKKV